MNTLKTASLVLLLGLVVAREASAQREDRRGFVGLGIGPSLPLGDFASASTTDPSAGRAFPGYIDTFLNIGYRRGERFGIAVFVSYSEYVWRDGGDDDWWQVATISAGPMYTRPLSDRAAVDLKGTIGLIALTSVIDNYTTSASTGSGLLVDARAAVRYDVFRRWAIFAEGGFQSSNVHRADADAYMNVLALVSGLGIAFRPKW